MDPVQLGVISALLLIVFCLLRIPIGYALGLVGLAGLIYSMGFEQALNYSALKLHSVLANFTFTAVPLFLLMGYFAVHAGLTTDAFEAARIWLARLPGGVASAVVTASALFGACSGSGLPAAAALGRIAVPDMVRSGYHPRLATGVVASATPLAVLIPPSIIMIIYGVITETSISRLLIAGIIPGIFASLVFMVGITLWVLYNPKIAPPYAIRFTWRERFGAAHKVWGIGALFLLVVGAIYLGWATPTEAAAFGAFGAMLLAIGMRKLNLPLFKDSLYETVRTTGMIFLIVGMANIFAAFSVRSGVIPQVVDWIIRFNPDKILFLIGVSVLFVILGMFLDSISMMVLALPAIYPMIVALDIDPVWFGVLVVIFVEIGAITPPLGLSVYVVKGVVGDLASLWDIFRGCGLFLFMWFIILATLIAFPEMSLWLPTLAKGAPG